MPVVTLERVPPVESAGACGGERRDQLIQSLRNPGCVALESWSDVGPWTILLPFAEEIVELPWCAAGDWVQFVSALEEPPVQHDPLAACPFLGGWAGFVSYDAGAISEGARPPDIEPTEPAAWFARHSAGFVIEPDGATFAFGSADEIARVRAWADKAVASQQYVESATPGSAILDSMGHGRYPAGVETIREAIRDGDVYQVNLTRRFGVEGPCDSAELYLALTRPEAPRCAAYLRGSDWTIASASPEVLLDYDRQTGVAESRPIKGTVRRGEAFDEEIRQLLASAKDASEHLMIVDLVRNDLGKVAPPGAVSVPAYRTIRTLPYVHHLESTVRAEGLGDRPVAEVMAALFPGGSITGAPKRAAVRFIRDLEPVARGVYSGAIGYLDHRGRSAFSVAIRTAVVTSHEVRYHAGGGIVWDSDPGAEDDEAMAKAAPFLGYFEGRARI